MEIGGRPDPYDPDSCTAVGSKGRSGRLLAGCTTDGKPEYYADGGIHGNGPL